MGSSYKGVNGSIHVEDDAVTFTREGMAARNAFGKNTPPRRVPLSEVTGLVHKPAGKVANGHLQLLRNHQTEPAATPAKDPDGIQYAPARAAEFDALAGWLQGVAEKNNPAAASPAAAAGAAQGSTRVDSTAPVSQPWYQRRAAQLVGAGLLGLILGSCGGDDSEDELAALRAEQQSTVEQLADARDRADAAEQDADRLRQQLESLQATLSAAPEPAPTTPPAPPAPVATTEAPAPPPAEPDNVSYANCSEVRAAGAAPIRRGDPGYSSSLDRDGDGVACET